MCFAPIADHDSGHTAGRTDADRQGPVPGGDEPLCRWGHDKMTTLDPDGRPFVSPPRSVQSHRAPAGPRLCRQTSPRGYPHFEGPLASSRCSCRSGSATSSKAHLPSSTAATSSVISALAAACSTRPLLEVRSATSRYRIRHWYDAAAITHHRSPVRIDRSIASCARISTALPLSGTPIAGSRMVGRSRGGPTRQAPPGFARVAVSGTAGGTPALWH